MKCEDCSGYDVCKRYGDIEKAEKCNKFNKANQTNFEFVQSCTMEELAELLVDISNYEGTCTICTGECTPCNCKYDGGVLGWVKWLKEKHVGG